VKPNFVQYQWLDRKERHILSNAPQCGAYLPRCSCSAQNQMAEGASSCGGTLRLAEGGFNGC
jgi:hypothetical protein